MSTRVGINGFGRIGRDALRAALGRDALEIVAVNDLTDARTLAHLLKYDSVGGNLDAEVRAKDGALTVNGHAITVLAERDPAELPWKDLGVDLVVESTGLFTDREDAAKHLDAGAARVIITAPAKDPDVTIVLGVNEQAYDRNQHHIISNASCATNCLAPVAKVLLDTFGIEHRLMTTIHAYTNDQRILDLPHRDLRRPGPPPSVDRPPPPEPRPRSGWCCRPCGKLDGLAIRVPTPNVSVVDFVADVERETSKAEVNEAFRKAAEGALRGVLGLQRGAAGVGGFQSKSAFGDRRCQPDQRRRQTPGESHRLVRQRMGLCLPGMRPHRPYRPPLTPHDPAKDWTMPLRKRSIQDISLRGKRVFMRVDFNVPLDAQGRVTDDTRIQASVPTIRYATESGAKVILASHLGRPAGKPDPKYSLEPVGARLAGLLGQDVMMAGDCVGPGVEALVARMQEGDVLLLENLRFHAGEEQNDPSFARQLARLADVYVNDAFGTAHRAHASTAGITRFVSTAVAGLLMQAELEHLGKLLTAPARPFIAILGGAKVSDKLGLILHLLPRLDQVLIGGGMAYTFLRAQGTPVGSSLVEEEKLEAAREILDQAASLGVTLRLPEDHVVAPRLEAAAPTQVVPRDGIPSGWMGGDIGPQTLATFTQAISAANTIVWNGPLGVCEIEAFAQGTRAIAHAVASAQATTIVGGGDTVAAVNQAGVAERITHISTGGGAFLELLEGRELPGVMALMDQPTTASHG